MDLYIEVLKQLLVEELYPATAAELQHTMYTGQKGIVVKVSGFNEKLPVSVYPRLTRQSFFLFFFFVIINWPPIVIKV